MREQWKPVANWPEYEVSNTGRVRRVGAAKKAVVGAILRSCLSKKGYPTVYLSRHPNRRSVTIHRLVAEAFLPRVREHQQVNHIDGDKTNNAVANLEWSNALKNNRHSWESLGRTAARGHRVRTAKLTTEQVVRIKRLALQHLPRGWQEREAKSMGINKATFNTVASGRSWGWVKC